MDENREIRTEIAEMLEAELRDPDFLEEADLDEERIERLLSSDALRQIAGELAEQEERSQEAYCGTPEQGRFLMEEVAETARKYLDCLEDEPEEGWLTYCYNHILARLFPETAELPDEEEYETGRALLMQVLRAALEFERKTLPFDPRKDLWLLNRQEVLAGNWNREYLEMLDLFREEYILEFMRIGCEITPFNTIGHIGGVHYVAMYMAYQLAEVGVPVDLAVISGAAALHDIGKYGCKKNEGKRVPYLHYYYTDLYCARVHLPAIGHIAVNHSVWDLELENLSVESLLLIYADFRVKSSRKEDGTEEVHFYTLKESFDVILNKLDNVDDAKRQRYQKVYAKLKDFEDYMREFGVETALPEQFGKCPRKPAEPPQPTKREQVLLEGEDIVSQLKYEAISHNIRLMSIFSKDSDFGNLIEAARSERQWKNVRTYINIFDEYSTYMTERQKTMTLKFLFELLSHREADIRLQAADLMGRIISDFNENYEKELPEGVHLRKKAVTNLSLFRDYLKQIAEPGLRYTEQHKKWIGYCMGHFVRSALKGSDEEERRAYLETLAEYYREEAEPAAMTAEERTEHELILLKTLMDVRPETDETFRQEVIPFIRRAQQAEIKELLVGAIRTARKYLPDYDEEEYYRDLRVVMGLPADDQNFQDSEGALFLEDLKMGTSWIIKVANIELMLRNLRDDKDLGSMMHLGMHLTNLLKVSETVSVRNTAGRALIRICREMTYSQRNELAVELFNGLETGDPIVSKYVPEFLGRLTLMLRPSELDEMIITLEQHILGANIQVAASMVNTIGVMLRNFHYFASQFPGEENAKRQLRMLYIMIKACSHYNRELSRDAFVDVGALFAESRVPMEQKDFLFVHCCKKIRVMLNENVEGDLDFYSNAAVLNHIYRYIGLHQFETGSFAFPKRRKACFYPGTFDPFSLGHKAVAARIRDMGFDVYLALDEFSWSKHTQPRLMRRKIMNMSVANEENMYPFPDDISINIANPEDVKYLKKVFEGKDLYIAVGSDVVENASAYKAPPMPDSIHTVNHIIFARESSENEGEDPEQKTYGIKADVIRLKLDKFYEDISSTKIRENIDLNRDISNLIDAVAQNFIYDNDMYLREPTYKHVLEAREIGIGAFKPRGAESLWPLYSQLTGTGYDTNAVDRYVEQDHVWTQYIDNAGKDKKMIAFSAVHPVGTRDLLKEVKDPAVAAHIRLSAKGSVASIGFFYADRHGEIENVSQIAITEMLTELIARDYAYAIYNPVDEAGYNEPVLRALKKQGFVNIAPEEADRPLLAVDMKSPVIIFRDVETIIKNPFNKDPRVLRALKDAHDHLLKVMNQIYPGNLILSFNMSAVHNKIIRKVAELNGVSTIDDKRKRRGPYMSVPFGKALSDVLVPNTVTKALHIEKYFNRSVKGFKIAEAHNYSSVMNQVRTIKSFNRPVILIDDLLHKGHRMRMLTPYLKKAGVEIKVVLSGVMTGRAMDLMADQNLNVESAYFLPTIRMWLNERDCYPFVGGDSIDSRKGYGGCERSSSVNLIMPYVKPEFIGKGDPDAEYQYSLTCLRNAKHIMETLQEVYQDTYSKRLTLKRLGEVITTPRIPDMDVAVKFDENVEPSRFIENDIERLIRLKWGD